MNKFKVGDVVYMNNKVGKIVYINNNHPISFAPRYIVDLGDDFKGHDGYLPDSGYNYKHPKKTCYYCFEDSLEKVDDTIEEITVFSTGALRDTAIGKAPMDLLPWDLLPRLANWYGKGAEKYGRNNWRLGQKKSHTFSSLIRHAVKYKLGQTDEDHLSAVIWNAFSLMNVDEYFKDNEDLNDL